MDLIVVKLLALFLLLLGTFTCGTLPILCFKTLKCFSEGKGENRITWFLIFFGGGVLMSTCFLHLIPEAKEAFPTHKHQDAGSITNGGSIPNEEGQGNVTLNHSNEGHHESFPLPEFLVLCGFFATYFIEEMIQFLFARFQDQSNETSEVGARFCSCTQRETECSRMYKEADESLFGAEKAKKQQAIQSANSPVPQSAPSDLLQTPIICQNLPNYGAVGGGVEIAAEEPNITNMPVESSPLLSDTRTDYISLGSLLTVAALSFHSLFEGFAIGFQRTVIGTWTLFFAVAMHKFVIAFVVGIEVMTEGGRASLLFAYMGVFACMSPIGMAVAISTGMNLLQTSPAVVGILSCIAAGTLLYVTFFEILQRKSHGHFSGICRFLATGFGAGFMALVQYLTTVL